MVPGKILIIGCVSRDLLHLPSGQSARTIGGAGLYTAIAARAAGADVTILAPRLENTKEFGSLPAGKVNWIGPACADDEFPFLEIRHHGNDQATLIAAGWGAESRLTPQVLPDDLHQFDIVHIAALSSALKQLEFLREIKSKSQCKISAGTYARVAYGETETVRELFSLCDYVFMNENESKAVFNETSFPLKASEQQIICITKGKSGAQIFSGNKQIDLAGLTVEEIDPTGAGDTFAGTFLAEIVQQHSLEQCAQAAIERSALVITKPGPAAIAELIGKT